MSYHLLLNQDKIIATILGAERKELVVRNNLHVRLMSSIMSQQLSIKVAAVIFNRFLALYDEKDPSPEAVLGTSHEVLRAIGLSNAKVQYVQNVASFFISKKLSDKILHEMDDEDLIALLTEIKGVGRWTVEMLLMFSMGREDIFSPDDLGIQQAMTKLYDLNPTEKKSFRADMHRISESWKPFRTYACLHLWAWNNK